MSDALKLAERLRNQAAQLRAKSTPLADLIPLLQQVADELERQDHNFYVLKDAVWKSCGDDADCANETINSQGGLK